MLDECDDDYTLANTLAAIRWPNGPRCPRCDSDRHCHLRARPRVYECLDCHKQQSVTAGTLLHGTRLPLRVWMMAIRLELRPEGLSTAELARTVGLSYDTAWHLKQRLQAAMRNPTEQVLHQLVETARSFSSAVRCPRAPWRERLPFAAFRDEAGAVHLSPLPQSGGVREAADRLPHGWDATKPLRAVIRAVNHRLRTVHHGVSELWFPYYLDAFATAARWRASTHDALELALDALLGRPSSPFRDLRPERPPHWLPARGTTARAPCTAR